MLIILLSVVSALRLPIYSAKRPIELVTTGSVPTELGNYFNELYYLHIQVGSGGIELSVLIDTGSKYLWLPNTNCETCEHADNLYNVSASSTSNSLLLNYTFKYGKASVTGTAVEDTVNILADNNTKLQNFPFLSVSNSSNFENFEADGILGLSFVDKALVFKNFVEELKSQGKIKVASFSLYLNSNFLDEVVGTNPTSTIIFGGYDMNFAKENFKFVKIDKSSGSWTSGLNKIEVDRMKDGGFQNTGILNLNSKRVTFNTGNSKIKVPTIEYNSLMSYILEKYNCFGLDTEVFCNCPGDYFFDTNLADFPVLRFYIHDEKNNTEPHFFELEPEYYVEADSNICRVMLSDFGENDYIVLGLPFLRRYYTYFDYEKELIGLAPAVKSTLTIYSTGNYLAVASFALISTVLGYYLNKSRKPANEAYLRLP